MIQVGYSIRVDFKESGCARLRRDGEHRVRVKQGKMEPQWVFRSYCRSATSCTGRLRGGAEVGL